MEYKNLPTHFQVQDNCHILQSSRQRQDAIQVLVHALLDLGTNPIPACRNSKNIMNAARIDTNNSWFMGKGITLEPDLFGLFTMFSNLSLVISNARFRNSLFCLRVSTLSIELSLSLRSFGYESSGFFFPCTGAMNNTCACKRELIDETGNARRN